MEAQRKYGVQTTLYFPLVGLAVNDYLPSATIATGDAKIMKDGGFWANVGASDLFVDEAEGYYSVLVTATQAQAKVYVVKIEDQTGPKEWEDQAIIISTFGQASCSSAGG